MTYDLEKTVREVRDTIMSFGFDEFMAGQITARLKLRGLIAKESFGDSVSTVLMVMEDAGLERHEVLAAVEEMYSHGVVFRER